MPYRDTERPLFPSGLREIDAPHRGGFPGVILTEVVDQRGLRVGRGQPFPVDP
jgi:hypothetical protein